MKIIFWALSVLAMAATSCCAPSRSAEEVVRPSEYVSTLVGTQSDYSLSAGNTYPAIALPWGMNFWTPQTGRMGDGWTYTYGAHTLRGFKQTHQPSPWMNDYGQFAVMPVRGNDKLDEESRQSWFSHQSEQARPYYYSVYLADHDVKAEVAPTERAAILRFTFPESEESGVVVDAFDHGSCIEMVDDHTLAGYTTRNSGGVPDNFRNYFVLRFDKPFSGIELTDSPSDYKAGSRVLYPEGGKRVEGEHAVAKVHFATRRGEQVNVRVASSFISPEQAVRNLESELGSDDFETVTAKAQQRWDDVLGRIRVEGGSDEQMRTFYSCLYRSVLFPRKFYEVTDQGEVVHRRRGEPRPLQPLQRRGASGLSLHRYRLLGYVPLPLPAAQPGLPLGQRRDSGRTGQRSARECAAARVGEPGPPRLHGGQQLRFGGSRCRGQGHRYRLGRPGEALRGDGLRHGACPSRGLVVGPLGP